jgi:hypothetical protein
VSGGISWMKSRRNDTVHVCNVRHHHQ